MRGNLQLRMRNCWNRVPSNPSFLAIYMQYLYINYPELLGYLRIPQDFLAYCIILNYPRRNSSLASCFSMPVQPISVSAGEEGGGSAIQHTYGELSLAEMVSKSSLLESIDRCFRPYYCRTWLLKPALEFYTRQQETEPYLQPCAPAPIT